MSAGGFAEFWLGKRCFWVQIARHRYRWLQTDGKNLAKAIKSIDHDRTVQIECIFRFELFVPKLARPYFVVA